MKEYMLLIRNRINNGDDWPQERHNEFLKKVEVYINDLNKNGNLISAQPLMREGTIIYGKTGSLKDKPLNEAEEVQVGYYHILANDFEEAKEIARRNPEFEYGTTARIEVRQIKTKENTTGFVYPKET
jgi:hypothetical protein